MPFSSDYGGPPVSAITCWPNDNVERSHLSSNRRIVIDNSNYSNNSGSHQLASVSSKSSSSTVTVTKTAPLVESVLYSAVAMLAGIALGSDIRICCSSW